MGEPVPPATPYWRKGDKVTICDHPAIHPFMHGRPGIVEAARPGWATVRLDGDRTDHWIVECPDVALKEREVKPAPPPEPTDLELVVAWFRKKACGDEWDPASIADAIERGDWKPKPSPVQQDTASALKVIQARVQALYDRIKDSNRRAYQERIAELEELAKQLRNEPPC